MNREIKFRAWDKNNNCWANLNDLTDWGTASFTACIGMGNERYPYTTFRIQSDERYEVQEFTGLKDKNGKEIYEGDIVKDEYGAEEVVFDGGGFKINEAFFSEMRQDENKVLGFEVIGNIYENSNLLK